MTQAHAASNFSPKHRTESAVEAPLKEFRVGEKFIYDVSWLGIPIGLVYLEVREKIMLRGRPAFHIVALARTSEFLTKIYPVRDQIQTFIDAERHCSLEFRKNVREGRYRAHERIIYDYAQRTGHYRSLKNKSFKEFPLESDVQDFLSAFFWFRLPDARVGQKLHVVLNGEEKNWDLEIDVQKMETKELKGNRVIPALVVEPKSRMKGMLYNRGRAWVYFSADAPRIPIWMKIQTPWGPISAVLRTSE